MFFDWTIDEWYFCFKTLVQCTKTQFLQYMNLKESSISKKQGLGANLIEATSCAKVMLTYGPSYVHVVRDDFGR